MQFRELNQRDITLDFTMSVKRFASHTDEDILVKRTNIISFDKVLCTVTVCCLHTPTSSRYIVSHEGYITPRDLLPTNIYLPIFYSLGTVCLFTDKVLFNRVHCTIPWTCISKALCKSVGDNNTCLWSRQYKIWPKTNSKRMYFSGFVK